MWRKKQIQRSVNMDNIDENEFEGYSIDYEALIKEKKCLAVTRLLAADLMTNPYKTVGDFMKELTDEDLGTLNQIADDSENPKYEDLILITQMLCSAEGLGTTFTITEVQDRVAQFVTLLACEGLARKGLVKIYRENMSFGPDMYDKIVVERL